MSENNMENDVNNLNPSSRDVNPILKTIAVWLAETAPVYLVEQILDVLIHIYNMCVEGYELPFQRINIEIIYNMNNTKDVGTSYDPPFNYDAICCDPIIDLEFTENEEIENPMHPDIMNSIDGDNVSSNEFLIAVSRSSQSQITFDREDNENVCDKVVQEVIIEHFQKERNSGDVEINSNDDEEKKPSYSLNCKRIQGSNIFTKSLKINTNVGEIELNEELCIKQNQNSKTAMELLPLNGNHDNKEKESVNCTFFEMDIKDSETSQVKNTNDEVTKKKSTLNCETFQKTAISTKIFKGNSENFNKKKCNQHANEKTLNNNNGTEQLEVINKDAAKTRNNHDETYQLPQKSNRRVKNVKVNNYADNDKAKQIQTENYKNIQNNNINETFHVNEENFRKNIFQSDGHKIHYNRHDYENKYCKNKIKNRFNISKTYSNYKEPNKVETAYFSRKSNHLKHENNTKKDSRQELNEDQYFREDNNYKNIARMNNVFLTTREETSPFCAEWGTLKYQFLNREAWPLPDISSQEKQTPLIQKDKTVYILDDYGTEMCVKNASRSEFIISSTEQLTEIRKSNMNNLTETPDKTKDDGENLKDSNLEDVLKIQTVALPSKQIQNKNKIKISEIDNKTSHCNAMKGIENTFTEKEKLKNSGKELKPDDNEMDINNYSGYDGESGSERPPTDFTDNTHPYVNVVENDKEYSEEIVTDHPDLKSKNKSRKMTSILSKLKPQHFFKKLRKIFKK